MKKYLCLLLLTLSAHAQEITPTEKFNQSLSFADDLRFENMDLAVERQLKSYQQRGLGGSIKFGETVYPRTALKESLLLLRSLFKEARECLKVSMEEACLATFNQAVNEKFEIYRTVPGKNEPGHGKYLTKFTSYYSPDLTGSRTPSARFTRAIYKKPSAAADLAASRVDIDYHGALSGKGLELFWVEESFFDLYLLHVQGGGRIKVVAPDGSVETKYLSYVSANGRPFQMIYKYMLQKGYITNASIPNQRKYLQENPHKQEEVFSVCPNYVFFRESDEEPVGVQSIPLTEGRSMAVDTGIYKSTGLINFVRTVKLRPGQSQKTPFSRFFISQDTGGAIKGNSRCDLYMGYGPEAELVAYNMNELGEQYILIKK